MRATRVSRPRRRLLTPTFLGLGFGFFLIFLFTFPRTLATPAFNSPRESVGYFLTERFLSGDGFDAPLKHAADLPEDLAIALVPRDAASRDGAVVPKDFAGTMLLYAALMSIWRPLALIVGPLFAVLGGLVVARIT